MNRAADRYYGTAKGGLFNLPHTHDPIAEKAMHDALRQDGKTLPPEHAHEHAARVANIESMINMTTVKAANRHAARGSAWHRRLPY